MSAEHELREADGDVVRVRVDGFGFVCIQGGGEKVVMLPETVPHLIALLTRLVGPWEPVTDSERTQGDG